MKHTFEDLVELMRINRKRCPWVKEKTLEDYSHELQSEVDEVKQALSLKDYENLKEEFGDVFLDLIMLMIIAEEQDICTIKECMEIAMNKIKRRKPWLLSDKKVTVDEAMKIWKEVKQHEKNSRENKKTL